MEKDDLYICDKCNNEVNEDDEFCTECGSLFEENIQCENHKENLAKGVCIICSMPYCEKCGFEVNNLFLCNKHNNYEIYQNMVRVYGTLDDLEAQYLKSCLEKENLHPILFCKIQPKGGPRFVYSLFEAVGDPWGNIVNEIKIMVPSQEVIKSEEIINLVKENK